MKNFLSFFLTGKEAELEEVKVQLQKKRQEYEVWLAGLQSDPVSEETIKSLERQLVVLNREMEAAQQPSPEAEKIAAAIDSKEALLVRKKERMKERVSSMEVKELEYRAEVLEKEIAGQKLIARLWAGAFIGFTVLAIILGTGASVAFEQAPWGYKPGIFLSIFVFFFLITGGWLAKSFWQVPEKQVWLIEAFGGFVVSWNAGPHFLAPFMAVRKSVFLGTISINLEMGGSAAEGKKGDVEFKNSSAGVNAVIFFRIFSPYHAVYKIGDVVQAVKDKMESGLRAFYGSMDIDVAIERRAELDLRVILTQDTNESGVFKDWGIKIESIAVDNFDLPATVTEQRIRKITAEKALQVSVVEKAQALVNAEKDFEVAKVVLKKAAIEAKTKQVQGSGEGQRMKAIAKLSGLTVQEVRVWDIATKKYTSAGTAEVLIMNEGGGESGAGIGAAAAAASAATQKKWVGQAASPAPQNQPAGGKSPAKNKP